ncbi:hypothetical protein NDU88_005458 [Pleurodeles waltl]|uniref:Uncharacterized protein n=1 Tax=Pleurodeles waltl TaxID=8319 RepID=A0AAV7NSC6_PLEWA|nr:hypothetical protein NDU88_005458 [Pleurodeles waltl]
MPPAPPKAAAALGLQSLMKMKRGLHRSRVLQWGEGGSRDVAAALSPRAAQVSGTPAGDPRSSGEGRDERSEASGGSLQTPTSSGEQRGGGAVSGPDPPTTGGRGSALRRRPQRHLLRSLCAQRGRARPFRSQRAIRSPPSADNWTWHRV